MPRFHSLTQNSKEIQQRKRFFSCSVCDCDGCDGFLGVPKCPTRSPLPIRDSIGACMGAAESSCFFSDGMTEKKVKVNKAHVES